MRPHTLIVGGTGLLYPVAVHIARKGHAVSVIARRVSRLTQLIHDTLDAEGAINIMPLDYRDSDILSTKLNEAIAVLGPITLAVVRVSAAETEAVKSIATILSEQASPCRVIDIVDGPEERRGQTISGQPDLIYHAISLSSLTVDSAPGTIMDEIDFVSPD